MQPSLLEQSPYIRGIYTQLCFCYASVGGTDQDRIVSQLKTGIERLTSSFPWLAGMVVETGIEDSPYVYHVETSPGAAQLTVRDYSKDSSVPGIKSMKEARFPFSILDERLFCSRSTLSERPGEQTSFPVILLQANFVDGGLLLTIQACHSVFDIEGQAQIIRLLSKACNGENFTEDEVRTGNLNRRDIVPLLRVHETQQKANAGCGSENGKVVAPEISRPMTTSDLTWAYFSFSAESIRSMKENAHQNLPSDTPFVSADDCIAASIWRGIARARLDRQGPSEVLTYTRQVDMRRMMSLPQGYLGNMLSQTRITLTLQDIADKDMATLAALLRRELVPETLKYQVRAQATEQAKSKGKLQPMPKDRGSTVTISSWAKVDLCNVGFNLGLGKPITVRRPRFTPIENLVYLMPKAADGEIVAGLCLRSDDMDQLKSDKDFRQYAELIV